MFILLDITSISTSGRSICIIIFASTRGGSAEALGPWDFGAKTYNEAVAESQYQDKPVMTSIAVVSAPDAVGALLDGLDAITAARSIQGSVGGARARKRYSGIVTRCPVTCT